MRSEEVSEAFRVHPSSVLLLMAMASWPRENVVRFILYSLCIAHCCCSLAISGYFMICVPIEFYLRSVEHGALSNAARVPIECCRRSEKNRVCSFCLHSYLLETAGYLNSAMGMRCV